MQYNNFSHSGWLVASRLYTVSMTTEFSLICIQLHLMSNVTKAWKYF